MALKRVTRTLVYEGNEEWVDQTIDKSMLTKYGPKFQCGQGTITALQSAVGGVLFTEEDRKAAIATIEALEYENVNILHQLAKLQRELVTNKAIIDLLSRIQIE